MLVLSRKKGQAVELPEMDVVVRVVGVTGSRVQLGIEAPREFTIQRSEKPLQVPSSEALEADRVRDELARVVADMAALAELADREDAPQARAIAAESIQRLKGIQRSLHVAPRKARSEARPISEFVKVRADVLEQLRQPQPDNQAEGQPALLTDKNDSRSTCVRQSPEGYLVRPSRFTSECSVA